MCAHCSKVLQWLRTLSIPSRVCSRIPAGAFGAVCGAAASPQGSKAGFMRQCAVTWEPLPSLDTLTCQLSWVRVSRRRCEAVGDARPQGCLPGSWRTAGHSHACTCRWRYRHTPTCLSTGAPTTRAPCCSWCSCGSNSWQALSLRQWARVGSPRDVAGAQRQDFWGPGHREGARPA